MCRSYDIMLILLVTLTAGCHKEKSPNWEVEENGIVPDGDYLILAHNDDHSESNPYELGQGSSNIVWEEDQVLPPSFFRNNECNKQFVIEIPDSTGITSFSNIDEDIYDNLKVAVYHRTYSKDDGYYRIHKGIVTGKKVSGEWIIDFRVLYGGKCGDKFRMVKGAAY